ncbi:MAG: dioxygenase [Egibacteraceae bacterium]
MDRRVFFASGAVLLAGCGMGSDRAPEASGASGASLPLTPECDDGDDPTPPQTEGPFYTPSSPQRNLVSDGVAGTPLTLAGVVLSRTCEPVAGALLDFWQADDSGTYDNEGYRLRGHQFAEADGRFRLDTIVPGLYPGRTRHLHVKVQAPDGPVLTTQLYFPDEPANDQDGIYSPQLVMGVTEGERGQDATFTFVVEA